MSTSHTEWHVEILPVFSPDIVLHYYRPRLVRPTQLESTMCGQRSLSSYLEWMLVIWPANRCTILAGVGQGMFLPKSCLCAQFLKSKHQHDYPVIRVPKWHDWVTECNGPGTGITPAKVPKNTGTSWLLSPPCGTFWELSAHCTHSSESLLNHLCAKNWQSCIESAIYLHRIYSRKCATLMPGADETDARIMVSVSCALQPRLQALYGRPVRIRGADQAWLQTTSLPTPSLKPNLPKP